MRRRWKILPVFCASALTVAVAGAVGAESAGPGGEAPQKGFEEPTRVEADGPQPNPAEARASLAAARDGRRQAGKTLTTGQRARLGSVPDEALHVVATFRTPMPWTVYESAENGARLARYALPGAVEAVTFYAEFDDGYPITSTGPPDAEFIADFRAFFAEPDAQRNMGNRTLPADIEERAVILGFSMRYSDFAAIEPDVRRRLDLEAAEVVASADDPPIGPRDPATRSAVDLHRRAYASGEVGA